MKGFTSVLIEFFASEPEVARLRSVLLAGGAIDRVSVLVALAWHLRPLDKGHPLRLADPNAAKDWGERGFDLARPTGWPHMLGARHMLSGSLLHDLKQTVRSCDALIEAIPLSGPNRTLRHLFLARIGGEEFSILLPDTGLEGGEIDAALKRVDVALYAARKGGRNLVRLDETARARRLSRGA